MSQDTDPCVFRLGTFILKPTDSSSALLYFIMGFYTRGQVGWQGSGKRGSDALELGQESSSVWASVSSSIKWGIYAGNII